MRKGAIIQSGKRAERHHIMAERRDSVSSLGPGATHFFNFGSAVALAHSSDVAQVSDAIDGDSADLVEVALAAGWWLEATLSLLCSFHVIPCCRRVCSSTSNARTLSIWTASPCPTHRCMPNQHCHSRFLALLITCADRCTWLCGLRALSGGYKLAARKRLSMSCSGAMRLA